MDHPDRRMLGSAHRRLELDASRMSKGVLIVSSGRLRKRLKKIILILRNTFPSYVIHAAISAQIYSCARHS